MLKETWQVGAIVILLVFAVATKTAADAPAERHAPQVLQPTESAAALVRSQLPGLVYSSDGAFLMCLKRAPGASGNDFDIEWVKATEIRDLRGANLARQLYPMRAAELVASFPLKAQVQEFQDKLQLKSAAEVLSAKSAEVVDGSPLPAFRFLGVLVQRRELDGRGEAVGKWASVEVEDGYAPLVYLVGGAASLPRDDPKLRPILFPSLAMPKLPTFGMTRSPPVDEYPPLEEGLKSLKAVLGATAEPTVPDVCLIRVFDTTIEPGKTYEYRIRVRMASLNSGRQNVGTTGDAESKELTAAEWYVLPQRVAVPTDLNFYAVDQAALDAKTVGSEANPRKYAFPIVPVRANQTTLQIQKWLDYMKMNRVELPVGDWMIAERVVATRGEPIGRQRVEVPYWRKAQDRFTMATDRPPPKALEQKHSNSVEAPFESDGKETILVDFRGGEVSSKRMPAMADAAPVEVLLCTADGKLLARNSAVDAADPDRVHRLEAVRAWIRTVKGRTGSK